VKVVLRLVQYIVALALFLAGALVVGVHVGAVLKGTSAPEGLGMPALALDLFKRALGSSPESPAWQMAPGLVLAAIGLMVARPPLNLTLAFRKPQEKQKSLRTIVHELTAPDSATRLKAAKTLTKLAKPSTIPAFIKALLDKTSEVRGQACEALENMTGLTFDYVDIAPEAVRKESVRQWLTWWQSNKAAILAGADPKTVGGGAPAAAGPGDDEELPNPDEEPGVGRGTPAPGGTAAVGSGTPQPGSVGAVGRGTPVPGGVSRQTPAPGGRNLSVGELLRRKRIREGTPLPGAMRSVAPTDATPDAAAVGGAPDAAAPDEAATEEASAPAAPPADVPAGAGPGDSPGADADDAAGDFLPSPDEELPPPE
jgi:hypothetical protein